MVVFGLYGAEIRAELDPLFDKSRSVYKVYMKHEDYRVGWLLNDEAAGCYQCKRQFGVLLRRHHCRSCGYIFCDRCSGQRVRITSFTARVCDSCAQQTDINANWRLTDFIANISQRKDSATSVSLALPSSVIPAESLVHLVIPEVDEDGVIVEQVHTSITSDTNLPIAHNKPVDEQPLRNNVVTSEDIVREPEVLSAGPACEDSGASGQASVDKTSPASYDNLERIPDNANDSEVQHLDAVKNTHSEDAVILPNSVQQGEQRDCPSEYTADELKCRASAHVPFAVEPESRQAAPQITGETHARREDEVDDDAHDDIDMKSSSSPAAAVAGDVQAAGQPARSVRRMSWRLLLGQAADPADLKPG